MEFFDRIGKQANETYQEAKERVSNISEEIKIRSKIANLKERKNTLYTEIGEIVYKEIKDNKDVDRDVISAKSDEITSIFEEIAKLETEILAFKKVKKCIKCEKLIDVENKYCQHCGAEQPEIKKEEVDNAEEVKQGEVINEDDSNNENQ
jgi:hypothetical protein